MFTSLVFTLMAFVFVGYMAESSKDWIEVGLLGEATTLIGLHKLQWIVILFLNVYFIGVYAYIWGRKIGFKFLLAFFWVIAGVAVLFLLWPQQRSVSGSFLEWGHLSLMAGFVIGAIVLSAQSYLQALNEQVRKEKMGSGDMARG